MRVSKQQDGIRACRAALMGGADAGVALVSAVSSATLRALRPRSPTQGSKTGFTLHRRLTWFGQFLTTRPLTFFEGYVEDIF
jgi:hypothetical protein